MNELRNSFNEKSDKYDTWINSVCPFYREVIETLVSSCPKNVTFMLDLGCGSGNVTHALIEAFPKIRATLVDISPKMLSQAKAKLIDHKERINFIEKDISSFSSNYTFDLIVSSLAMHHLEPKQKEYFCENVLKHLVSGGCFFLIEQVIGGTAHFQEKTHTAWLDFMRKKGLSEVEIEEVLTRKHKHDHCEPLMKQLELLKKTGFVGIDVLFKRDSIVLFGAQKY